MAAATTKDPIGRAAKLAEKVNISGVEDLEMKVEEMKNRRFVLDQKERGLLGVEQLALQTIRTEKDVLSQKIAAMDKEIAQANFSDQHGIRRLSREPLTWRKDGMPTIVPFTIEQNFTQIVVDEFGRMSIGPDRVRYLIGDSWGDLTFDRPNRGKRHNYVARFKGVFPQHVREMAVRWSRESLFVFSEADEWSMTEEMAPTYDPLLVLSKHGALWLLAKFDATPIEEYIADEFTS